MTFNYLLVKLTSILKGNVIAVLNLGLGENTSEANLELIATHSLLKTLDMKPFVHHLLVEQQVSFL